MSWIKTLITHILAKEIKMTDNKLFNFYDFILLYVDLGNKWITLTAFGIDI